MISSAQMKNQAYTLAHGELLISFPNGKAEINIISEVEKLEYHYNKLAR